MEVIVIKYYIDDTMQGIVKTVGYFSSIELGLDYIESNFQNIVIQYDDDDIIFYIESIFIDTQETIDSITIKYNLERFNNGIIINNKERGFKQFIYIY